MQPKEHWLDINGIRVHALDWGESAGRAILYFPIYSGHTHETDEFAKLIAGKLRFVAVDARGHGESGWGPADRYSPEQYYADAVAVRDALGLEKPILMGSSFGAATALRMAATEPDRCEALIMDDQPPEMPSESSKTSLEKTFERQKDQRFASMKDLVDWTQRARAKNFNWGVVERGRVETWAGVAAKQLPDGEFTWRNDPEIYRCLAAYCGTPEANLRPLFSAINVPFLVIRRDGEGASLPDPVWRELQTLNPRATYVTVSGAGHPVVFTHPKETTGAVLAFLGIS